MRISIGVESSLNGEFNPHSQILHRYVERCYTYYLFLPRSRCRQIPQMWFALDSVSVGAVESVGSGADLGILIVQLNLSLDFSM